MTADRPATEPRTEPRLPWNVWNEVPHPDGMTIMDPDGFRFGRPTIVTWDEFLAARGYCTLIVRAEAAQGAAPLADAASEMLLWIDTYDDAMGHGYCAMQSGEPGESCTCGFDEKRERWKAAIEGAAPRAEGLDVLDRLVRWKSDTNYTDSTISAICTEAIRLLDAARRPSDERVPESEERAVCKRFRHDEHCIDEPHG